MTDYNEDLYEFPKGTPPFINYLIDCLHSCKNTEDTLTLDPACDVKPNTSHRTELGDTLCEAFNIINGNRQDMYGTPEDSFQRIADYWNSYLQHTQSNPAPYEPLHAVDVANMMILFKLAREEHEHTHDNYVDICGYAAIADNMYPRD